MAATHILALILTATTALATPIQQDANTTDYRLPDIYDVSSYELELNVPKEAFTGSSAKYTGKVTIKFAFTKEADSYSFHAHKDFITLKKVSYNGIDYNESDYQKYIDPVTNIAKLDVTSPVHVNLQNTLVIEFEGRLSTTDMYGFYKSSYVNKKDTKYLATTQFEPTHARRAFPCFDEPGLKATFAVTISYPSDLKVLFNTPSTNTTTKNGVTTDIFETTPKMSVYLIAIVISEFSCTAGDKVDTATYQVCSRDDTLANRKLAVDVGPQLLNKLSELTAYKYSNKMHKMDQVAIPDFSAGAMENWGLITYRETALLWNEKESSNRYKQSITTTIAHEFTHQWFGNLVTCKWWSETFLNEGFATYFQYFITHQVYPEWELDKQFVVENVQAVLDVDELENSQALQSDCGSPTEVSAKFGTVSYNKGASILKMVNSFLSEDNFVAGLRQYLVNNQLKGAKPEQLWESLSTTVDDKISKLPDKLATVMDSWIKKPGFPLLTVKLDNSTVSISQERFLVSGSDNTTKWYVPISYTTSNDSKKFESTTPAAWLTPKGDLKITLPKGAEWLVLNNQGTGYYRVNYDETLWGYIKTALSKDNFDGITEVNRAQIVDDLFSLAKVNKVSYQNLFEISRFLTNDISYYPWYSATQGYDFLLKRVGQNSKLGKAISASLLSLMRNLYASVPIKQLNDTNQVYTLKQVLALSWACKLGEENCVSNVQKIFSQYKSSKEKPDKNLRTIVYCNGLRYSEDSTDWDFLWEAYSNATDLATERGTIISALGCTRNVKLLEEYLNKTITDNSGIRSQDAFSVFSAVYNGNPEGVSVAYDFLTDNHKKIADKYQSMNSLSNLIKGIADKFTTEEEVRKLKDFSSKEDLTDEFKVAATEAAEVAESNLNWLKSFEKDLEVVFDVPGAAIRISSSSLVVLMVALIAMVFAS